jgi:hypothetical protein
VAYIVIDNASRHVKQIAALAAVLNLGRDVQVRPDFLVVDGDKAWIVDAKYKVDWSWRNPEHRPDVFQVLAYSRHKKVLEEIRALGGSGQPCDGIVVLYPLERSGMDANLGERLCQNVRIASRTEEFDIPLVALPISLPNA